MKFTAKKLKKLLVKICVLFAVGFVVFLFINQYIKIRQKKIELGRINSEISSQKNKNDEMKRKIKENDSDTQKSDDYLHAGQRVFENVTE